VELSVVKTLSFAFYLNSLCASYVNDLEKLTLEPNDGGNRNKKIKALLVHLRDLYKLRPDGFSEIMIRRINQYKNVISPDSQDASSDFSRTFALPELSALDEVAKLKREHNVRVAVAHKAFLKKHGLNAAQVILSSDRERRTTHCYDCQQKLDSDVDVECTRCHWIICSCGACGCGFQPA